jgi:sporulation protein YlmC with PRC-barrel domain
MEKITELLFCEVFSQEGEHLGRVFDLRCPGEPEHGDTHESRTAGELIYGTRGVLELIGFKKTAGSRVAWEKVKSIEQGKIIIDAG